MNLYKINSELQALTAALIQNGGEITPEQELQLANLELSLETKCLNIQYVVNELEHDCTKIDTEIKRLQAMKKARVNTVARLKNNVKAVMQSNGLDKIETETHKISFRKSESVEIYSKDCIPAKFTTIKQEIKHDKTAIKKAIKSGEEIPGAKLVTNQNIQM